MKLNLLNRLSILKEREDYDVVYDTITRNSESQGTNLWILFFAILIACLGLNINSTAVIIGAMLISPLIGPIVGIGFGIAINDLKLIRVAFTSYMFATIVGLVASTIYFLISPIGEAHSEILSRTAPSLYDVLIAFCGGFAGIIALSSKVKGNVIPGVAIATALMPPLCTAGFGIAHAELNFFLGAFYLYIINSVFIFAATAATTPLLRFPAKKYADANIEKKEKRISWAIIILTLIPSLYLGYNILQKNDFINRADEFINQETNFENVYLLKREILPGDKSILLTYGGRKILPQELNSLREKLKYYQLDDVSLNIKYGFTFSTDDKSKEQLQQVGNALNETTHENLVLKTKLDSMEHRDNLDKDIYIEIKALYPEISKAVIQPVKMFVDSNQIANTFLVAISVKRILSKTDQEKFSAWLHQRIKADIKLIIEKE
ncbi:MAG: DUF389 domain-containing protein [Saprospiraceae bacterium]